jgi:hypothetical protein
LIIFINFRKNNIIDGGEIFNGEFLIYGFNIKLRWYRSFKKVDFVIDFFFNFLVYEYILKSIFILSGDILKK